MRLTIQYRLTLIFTGVMALLLFSVNIIMYHLSSSFREENFFRSLEDRAKILAVAHANEEFEEILNELKEYNVHRIYEAEDIVVDVDLESRRVLSDSVLPYDDGFFEEIFEKGSAWSHHGEKSFAGVLFNDLEDKQDIVVVSSAEDIKGNAYRKKLRFSLLVAFIVAVLTMVATSIVFSKRLFDPVVRLIQKINNINAFNLGIQLEKEGFEDEIAELRNTFNGMLARIDSAFKTQQKFIGNTSHSLRTPLTIIMGEAELAMATLDQKQDVYQTLETINEEAEKLNHIINMLLELARSGTGKQKNEWGKIEISGLISAIENTVMRMNNKFKLKLPSPESSPAPSLQTIGNESLLNLALTNIILNGIKYSGNQPVKIKYGQRGQWAWIRIIDRGIGIPPEDLAQIFSPYFRASNSQDFDGFGIGLSLSWDIVKMHQGNIHVESKLNLGTIFEVELPLAIS